MYCECVGIGKAIYELETFIDKKTTLIAECGSSPL